MKKILLATNNRAKVDRYRMLTDLFVIHTPAELNLEKVEVEEDKTLEDNAVKKAQAYFGKTDFPILANDTGLYIEGEGLVEAPKRIAIGDNSLSDEEAYQNILCFWQNIARKYGGKVSGYWLDVFALVMPDGSVYTETAKRGIILTDQIFGKPHIKFPIRALYLSKDTNKPSVQHTPEEEMLELNPIKEALSELYKKIVDSNFTGVLQ